MTSPILSELLSRWTDRSNTLRKSAADFHEEATVALGTLDAGRRAYREQRERSLRHLEQDLEQRSLRWDKRLSRLPEWQAAVQRTAQEAHGLRSLTHTYQWLEAMDSRMDPVVQRLERIAKALLYRQKLIRARLHAWEKELAGKALALKSLAAESRQAPAPREQRAAEIAFMQTHRRVADDLSSDVQALRQTLNRYLGRIQKTLVAIEHRTATQPVAFASHKQALERSLLRMMETFNVRREETLADALHLEASRQMLRQVQDHFEEIRWVEAPAPAAPSRWRKLLG